MKKKIVLFIVLFLFCIFSVKAAPSESDNYAIGETGYPTFNDALAVRLWFFQWSCMDVRVGL